MSQAHDELSLRHYLRRSTAPDHARAEAVHWTGSDFRDRAGYERYLNALQQAHLVWGCGAAQVLDQPDEAARHEVYAGLIAEDCRSDPPGATTPASMSRDMAWGVTYALVGSALGASMILRKLLQAHDWPMAYLKASHAHATSGGVLRIFDALDASGADRNRARQGACALFRVIETHEGEASPANAPATIPVPVTV